MLIIFTEERINKLEKELEDANDLLAAARQRGNKHTCYRAGVFPATARPFIG